MLFFIAPDEPMDDVVSHVASALDDVPPYVMAASVLALKDVANADALEDNAKNGDALAVAAAQQTQQAPAVPQPS